MFKTLIFRSRDLHLKSFLNPRFYYFFPVPYTMVPWRNAISCIHNWIVCCSTICVHIVFTQIRSGLISLQWQSIYERTHKVIKGAVLKTTDQVWVLVLKLRHEQDRFFQLWWFSGEEMKVNDGRWGMIWSHCFPLMITLQTSDYLDWLANGVNHSHPDFGGPGCYTFRSSSQWVSLFSLWSGSPIAITMANCAKCNHTFMVHS